jgi:hypothetical protein
MASNEEKQKQLEDAVNQRRHVQLSLVFTLVGDLKSHGEVI